MSNWSVYIIHSDDDRYYTGISTDVERRFQEHRFGKLGAKFFNGRKPVKIIHQENGLDRSGATKREMEIKNMTRREKELMIGLETN